MPPHATVLPLLAILVGFEMGVSLFGPLLPQVQREFGVSAGTVALALSVYHGSRLVVNLPMARFVARSVLPVTLGGGGVLFAAGAVLVAAAWVFPAVLVGRALMGIGAAAFFVTTQLWISKVATPQNKAQLFSYNQVAALTGGALGPAIGGAVAGWLSWRWSLVLAAVFGMVALVAGRRLSDPNSGRADGAAVALPDPDANRRLGLILGPGLVMMALMFFYGGVTMTLVPLFAARQLHLGPAAIGGVLMLGTLWRFGAALVGGRLAAWFGIQRVVVPGLAVLAASVLSFLLVGSPLGLVVAVSLVSWANLGGSLVVALVTDLVPEPHWGTALGVNRTMADLGAMTAPILVGIVIDRYGFDAAIVTVAALLFAAAAAAAALIRSSRHDALAA
ncbi:MAG: MFS transporter [Armatimonadota bacterium]|nr:MFS transporter [Armatimonadota bacterium]